MIAVMVLAAALATQPTEVDVQRDWLIGQYSKADSFLVEIQQHLGDEFNTPPDPVLGLELETVEQGGHPAWRATMVTGTMKGSEALMVGILAGDRLVVIGTRWLEHETGKAVNLYLSDFPDFVPLVIERDGHYLSFRLHRTQLPCESVAQKVVDQKKWQERIRLLRRIEQAQAEKVPALVTPQGLEEARKNLETVYTLITTVLERISDEFAAARALACASPGP